VGGWGSGGEWGRGGGQQPTLITCNNVQGVLGPCFIIKDRPRVDEARLWVNAKEFITLLRCVLGKHVRHVSVQP